MGFRTGAYATVWEIKPRSSTDTTLRIAISRKNRQTGEYEQEFSGFVSVYGTAAAAMAAKLHEGDRIKLGDCDVSTRYDPAKKTTYPNFKLFSFDLQQSAKNEAAEPDSGEVDAGEPDFPNQGRLPF